MTGEEVLELGKVFTARWINGLLDLWIDAKEFQYSITPVIYYSARYLE
jgi:hypothetical protein